MKNILVMLGLLFIASNVRAIVVDPPIRDVPRVYIDYGNNAEMLETENVDLTAEHVTPIFQELKQRLDDARSVTQENAYKVYQIQTEDNHNDKLVLTYTANRSEVVGEDYTYVVKIQTGNAYAANEEDRIHEQRLEFNCRVIQPLDIFMCLPKGCALDNFEAEDKPEHKCERDYLRAVYTTETVYEITKSKDGVDGFLECVEGKIQTVTLNSALKCYYIGFKQAGLKTEEDIKQELLENGFTFDADKVEFNRFGQATLSNDRVDVKKETAFIRANQQSQLDNYAPGVQGTIVDSRGRKKNY